MTRKEITAFYNAHSRRLYNMSYRILLNAEDAEEVMQDTILKYVTLPLKPAHEAQASAWLARTCIRASIDRLRKQRREALLLEEILQEQRTEMADEEISDAIPAQRVLEAIRRLPDPYRLVVNLLLVEGLDYEEIAQYTGWKESTLRSHFHRGKVQLLAMLKHDGASI